MGTEVWFIYIVEYYPTIKNEGIMNCPRANHRLRITALRLQHPTVLPVSSFCLVLVARDMSPKVLL